MSGAKPPNERTKVVVRNLPPTLGLEAFKEVLDKHIPADSYNWLQYYPGKISVKRTVFSRCFINFNTAQDVVDFKTRFEGHLFVSARGTQYRCTVEYAPFQKVPATRTKKLPMEGTIEKNPEYQAFVKEYEEGPRPAPTAQALLEAHEAAKAAEEAKGPVVTALMAFLQQKYEAGTSLGGRRGARGARSSGSGSGSRREPGGRLSTVEEDVTTSSKGSKARSGRSSKADAAATAAAAAAAAGAATAALKGSKHKPGRHTQQASAGTDQQQSESTRLVSRHGSSRAAESSSQADAGHGSRHSKHTSRGGAAEPAAAEPSKRGTKARGHSADAAEDDEQDRAAAAASLAAASAANAAAAAARKARVKAGHQVYTPGAGGRLFAAAMSKSAGEGAAAGSNKGRGGDAAAAGSGSQPAASDGALKKEKAEEGGGRRKGPIAAEADNSSSGRKGSSKAVAGGSGDAAAVPVGMAQLDVQGASSSSNSSGGRGGRGGRAGGRGSGRASRSTQGSQQQQQQQQWVAKADGTG